MYKVLIVGTGAIAKFIGAKLQNCAITFLGNHIGSSYSYTSEGETFLIDDYKVLASLPKKSEEEYFDLIIWVTSTVFNLAVLQKNQHWFKNYTGLVFNFQNGMGYEDDLISFFPKTTIHFGITNQAVLKNETGILNTGSGSFYLPFDESISPTCLQVIKQVDIRQVKDILALRYQKLSINAVVNPITAYFKINNGAIFNNKIAAEFVVKIIEETYDSWKSKGIYSSKENYLIAIQQICKATARNKSSMLQAVQNGIPLELESVLGFVIKTTKSPTLQFLFDELTKSSSKTD